MSNEGLKQLIIALFMVIVAVREVGEDARIADRVDKQCTNMVCEGSWPNYRQATLDCSPTRF